MNDIIERLRDTSHSFTAASGRLEAADIIEGERALADDLAAVLSRPIDSVGGTWQAQVERALARYREARER